MYVNPSWNYAPHYKILEPALIFKERNVFFTRRYDDMTCEAHAFRPTSYPRDWHDCFYLVQYSPVWLGGV